MRQYFFNIFVVTVLANNYPYERIKSASSITSESKSDKSTLLPSKCSLILAGVETIICGFSSSKGLN